VRGASRDAEVEAGSGSSRSGSEKILPLPLRIRLFDLKNNLVKKFCPVSNVD